MSNYLPHLGLGDDGCGNRSRVSKINTSARAKLVPVLMMCLMAVNAYGQFASNWITMDGFTSIERPEKPTPLAKVLVELETHFGVNFSYDVKVVEEKFIGGYRIYPNELKKTLDNLLTPLKLQYKEIDKNYYVIQSVERETKSNFAIISDNLEAQIEKVEFTVEGTVTSAGGNEPLPGVNVVIKGTTQGTVTDVDGKYTISVPDEGAVLIFSFIGYAKMEIPVEGRSVIDIVLLEDVQNLEEIVVIGYGTQTKGSVTGSIASVDAKFLENRPITNSSQALQGITGVHVNQVGSQPGSDNATLRIRGVGTLNNNDPLVLVNGVEYDLMDVNPNDIESITVLKDAASAAIYGNRASNGVILVTTKSGKEGALQVNYNNYLGVQEAIYLPDQLTNSVDWMTSLNQAYTNEGQPVPFTDAKIDEYRTGTDPYIYPNTDWFDLMFDPAFIQEHNLRLSGGSDDITYSVSLGYLDQDGILMSTDAKKYSFNSNTTFDLSDKMQFGFIITGTQWNRHEPASGIEGIMGSAVTRSLPIDAPLVKDGSYGGSWLENDVPGRTWRNPLAWAKEGGTDRSSLRLMANIFTEYNFSSGITYKANLAVNKLDANDATFVPEVFWKDPKDLDTKIPLRMPENRSATRRNTANQNISFFQTLAWSGDISAKSSIDFLGGFSMESFDNSYFMSVIEGFLSNELTELNAGSTNRDVAGTSSDSRLMSFFGRAGYSYSEKYLLEFNMRYDGSSRFAKAKRWGFFPSVSAAWRVEKERFMENVEFIDNLKVRASWGQLGNQNLPLFSYVNKINLSQGYSFNNNVAPGSAVIALSDPNITWETTTIKNVGLDIGLWENKLEFVVDIFDKKTEDILTQVNLAAQVGNLDGPVTNLYSISNKGVEFGTNYNGFLSDFTYSFGGSISYIHNNVEFLNGDIQFGSSTRWGDVTIVKEGYPVNSFYLYKADGLFRSQAEIDVHTNANGDLLQPLAEPGDIRYLDVDGDGTINSVDRIVTGRTIPQATYSFNFSLHYKRFDLTAFFQGVQGVNGYPSQNFAYPNHNGAGLTKSQYANSWTPENPDASLPRLTLPVRGSQRNYILSTFWLQDMSYLRVKNLQIGYNLPNPLLEKLKLRKVKIFANAQNLFTFSKFTLADPERTATLPTIYEYPTARVMSLGLNINF